MEKNLLPLKGDTVSLENDQMKNPVFDPTTKKDEWAIDANVYLGGGPDAFGYKRLSWETRQESRANMNRYFFNLAIWGGMALLSFVMIIVSLMASAKDDYHRDGILALTVLLTLLILCVVMLFRRNNCSIIKAISRPLNRWVFVNYLLFVLPWIIFPWVFDDGDKFAIAAILWFTSGPVFVLNSSGQMWFRFQRFQGRRVRSVLTFRNVTFLLLVNFIYISPFIAFSNQITSDVGGMLCCIALIAVIMYGLGYIYFALLYHELVDKMGLEDHFFFGGEKGLMSVIPVIHIIGSVLLVFSILMIGGGG